MMRRLSILSAFVLSLFTMLAANTARAEFYIEPYFNALVSGSTEGSITLGPTIDLKGDVSGTMIGARVGWEFIETLAVGFTYEISKGDIEFDNAALGKADMDSTSMGAFVAFEFPVLVRAYASYMFSVKNKDGSDTNKGNGTRLGVGFTGLPFVSINVEMFNNKFDETDTAGVTAFDLKANGIALGVSVPLSF